MDSKKITHLEGLRGLCCLIVVFDHCVNKFFPALRYTGVSKIKDVIAWSPLNLIYSGSPSVMIFFILSGFVLSNNYNKTKDRSLLISSSLKRYPRLISPIFFAMIVMYLSLWASNEFFMTRHLLTIFDVFIQSFINVPFGSGTISNGVLWTMVFEIYGSFLVFATLAIFGCYKNKYYIYLILFIVTFDSYYCLFIFGMILNSMLHDNLQIKTNNLIISNLAFVVSFFLMAFPFPREGVEVGPLYKYLMLFGSQDESRLIISKVGSMLLFWSVFNFNYLIKFFDSKLLQKIGAMSFSIYILHMPMIFLIINFSSSISDNITRLGILSIAVFASTLTTAYFFEKYIDRNAVKYTNIFVKKIS